MSHWEKHSDFNEKDEDDNSTNTNYTGLICHLAPALNAHWKLPEHLHLCVSVHASFECGLINLIKSTVLQI